MEDEKLKKMKEILYSNPKYKNMKIGYRIEEGKYYLIYHYQKNFNIFDMEFHELMSKIIEEIFYKNGITKVGQRDILEREVKEYFPEKNNNLHYHITLQNVKVKSRIVAKNLNTKFVVLNYTNNIYSKTRLKKYSKPNKTTHSRLNINYSNFI